MPILLRIRWRTLPHTSIIRCNWPKEIPDTTTFYQDMDIIFRLLASVLAVSSTVLAINTIITSQIETNWGAWGSWDRCPQMTYASGMRLKNEAEQGGGDADDTALNGIRLLCTSRGPRRLDQVQEVASSVGRSGDWGNFYQCSNGGFITGFQLRAEGEQGEWKNRNAPNDDTAANNLRVFCSGEQGYIKGDGRAWGTWGLPVKCQPGQLVCGIRTQVEYLDGNRKGVARGDDTGLNNVQMECCDVL